MHVVFLENTLIQLLGIVLKLCLLSLSLSLSLSRHFSVAIDKYLVELQTLDPSTPDINTLTAGLRNLKRELQRNLDTIK